MTATNTLSSKLLVILASTALFTTGCSDGVSTTAAGDVQIFVEAEDSIPNGLSAGTADEDIQDGWNVSYSKFLISIGNFRAARSDSTATLEAPGAYVLDLMNVPAGGYVVHTWKDVEAVRWDRFGFDLPNAGAESTALAPTSDTDRDLLITNEWSVYMEGQISKDTQTKTFKWGLSAGTSFDDCADENGLAGFAVPSGGSVAIKPTIHGDHWFFNNITAGAEITKRYAQYIADADADMDGETTLDELKALAAATAFPTDKYNLAGANVETAYDFVVAQARTLGDYQGEGECPTRKNLP